MITFTIPMPPSVNRIWRNGRDRTFRDKSYMAWILQAGTIINTLHLKPVEPPYAVTYELGRANARSDLDNRAKALSDILEKMGLIKNDRFIIDLHMRWAADVLPGDARVTVKRAE